MNSINISRNFFLTVTLSHDSFNDVYVIGGLKITNEEITFIIMSLQNLPFFEILADISFHSKNIKTEIKRIV